MAKGQMPSLPETALEKSEVVSASEVKSSPLPQLSKPIKVIALGNGFFAQERKKEGDEFEVPSMKWVGAWMRCLDPQLEKLHQEEMKAKKEKAKKAAADE